MKDRTNKIEIKAEFLCDYLAARKMALRLAVYQSRKGCMDCVNHINWENGKLKEQDTNIRYKGSIDPIHSGGEPYGSTIRVLRMWRNDVDQEIDVPVMSEENDNNVEMETYDLQSRGDKIYRVIGEYWRDEWIEPSTYSPLVRGIKYHPHIFYRFLWC